MEPWSHGRHEFDQIPVVCQFGECLRGRGGRGFPDTPMAAFELRVAIRCPFNGAQDKGWAGIGVGRCVGQARVGGKGGGQ